MFHLLMKKRKIKFLSQRIKRRQKATHQKAIAIIWKETMGLNEKGSIRGSGRLHQTLGVFEGTAKRMCWCFKEKKA